MTVRLLLKAPSLTLKLVISDSECQTGFLARDLAVKLSRRQNINIAIVMGWGGGGGEEW
jgi:hypothetical protein